MAILSMKTNIGGEMTEIEGLIKEAEEIKKRWRKSKVVSPLLSELSWQELLDGKPYPHLNVKNL